MSHEYRPDLGVNDATIESYDRHFTGARGQGLKTKIRAVATEVDLDPGLLASHLLAEVSNPTSAYLRTSGNVRGYHIGIDSWNVYAADIKKKVPAANRVTFTGNEENIVNEKGNTLASVPIVKAQDAMLASASYLKYAELRIREFVREVGGAFDRLPIEYRFFLTRYGTNAGLGKARTAVREHFGARLVKRKGITSIAHDRKPKQILSFRRRPLKSGIETFHRKYPRRAATVHTAQAIHLSQQVFGIPFRAGDSLLFMR